MDARDVRYERGRPLRGARIILLSAALFAGACSSTEEDPNKAVGQTKPASASLAESTGAQLPQGSEPANLDPADFVARIDNPYWPMAPGSKWVYREYAPKGAVQRVEVTVTRKTKDILGIAATVVHDIVTEGGQVVEDTWDWYGQDRAGNLWYLGEDTKEYANGKVASTEGSWEAGVDGAEPGVVVPAAPQAGMEYRQEYYKGEAEDLGKILSLDEWVQVPAGFYDGVLMTRDYTPLEPKVLEHKFYAPGVGPALVLAVSGGAGREELIKFHKG